METSSTSVSCVSVLTNFTSIYDCPNSKFIMAYQRLTCLLNFSVRPGLCSCVLDRPRPWERWDIGTKL